VRRLAEPLRVAVRADRRGRPLSVGGRAVDAIRETWLIEDRWWTAAPVRRRYWEVVTASGELLILFRELQRGGWYRHR
jgi:CO dehydrogenase/acetyl-CoA synthase delta subunit